MKLSDIPQKPVFEVPEGYFDRLPGIIQARMARPAPSHHRVLVPALRFALPVLLAGVIIWQLARPEKQQSPQEILSSVQTEELILYLAHTDITLHEILDNLDPAIIPGEVVEQEVYNLFEDEDLTDDDLLNSL